METLGRSIFNYMYFRIGSLAPFPQTLDPLVPEFLPAVPGESPLGPLIAYESTGGHFSLTTILPGAGKIRYEDGAFTVFPPGVLTDREAARIIRAQVADIATALEEYRIDNNAYPLTLSDVLPNYRRFLPAVDPYGRDYGVTLTSQSYAVSSQGRDGAPGGSGFDADTVMRQILVLASTTPYVGEQEYVRHAFFDLRNCEVAIEYFVGQTGHLPATLPEAADMIDAGTHDLCGNMYVYQPLGIGSAEERYTITAPGCDGVLGTDLTEGFVLGSNISTCRETPYFPAMALPKIFD